MKKYLTYLIFLLLTGLFASPATLRSQACESAQLQLDSILPNGPNYDLYISVCLRGGDNPVGSHFTNAFAFNFYGQVGLTALAFTPTVTSDTLNTLYTSSLSGSYFGSQFSLTYQDQAQNMDFVCAVQGPSVCGGRHEDCKQYIFTLNALPDTVQFLGMGSGGNIPGPCSTAVHLLIECFPVVPNYPLRADGGPDQQICAQGLVNLNGSVATGGTPAYLYNWTPAVFLSNPSIPNPACMASTSLIYLHTVTDQNNCVSTDPVLVEVPVVPTISLGPDTVDLCFGTPSANVCIQGLPPGFSIFWSTGGTNTCEVMPAPGTHWVIITDGCVADTDTVTLRHLPQLNLDLGPDTLLCNNTLLLDAGPFFTAYTWSQGATTQSIVITQSGTYHVTVYDANGCDAEDSIHVELDTACVWPGDANYDLVADNNDLLALGLTYGSSGPIRPNSDTSWTEQAAYSWGSFLPNNRDYKHSDCDGNGLVDSSDVAVINHNYGRGHLKTSGLNGTQTAGPDLWLDPQQDSVAAGDTLLVIIHLGRDTLQADSVYGIAFTMAYDRISPRKKFIAVIRQ